MGGTGASAACPCPYTGLVRGRPWLTVAVAAGVAAVAALAVLDAARSDTPPEGRDAGAGEVGRPLITGPDVPSGATLPGRLVVLAGPDCRLQVLDLVELKLGAPGPATACRLWPSPRGDLVAFERQSDEGPTIWLASTGSPPTRRDNLGLVASPPAWGPDGDRLALCRPDGSTVVVTLDGEELDRIDGCHPRFAPDGRVVPRPGATRKSPTIGRPRVVGHDVGEDGSLALALLRSESAFRLDLTLELRMDGKRERVLTMPRYGPTAGFYGLHVSIAPGGQEVAVTTPDLLSPSRPDDLVALLDLRSGRAIDGFTEQRYRGLAWSPDGVWLAFSTGDEVLVYGPARTDPVYVLPLKARALGWLRAQPRPGTRPLPRRRGVRPPPRRRGAGAGSRT